MILLHTTKYGDSSIILHCYTRGNGRESFIIRGMGRKKGGNSTALLHPLSILEGEGTPQGSNNITHLKEYSPKYPLTSLRGNIYKNTIAIYISELLYRTLRDYERDPALYDFLEQAILTLNAMEKGYSNFHLWFTIKYISFLGFMPDLSQQEVLAPFDPMEQNILKGFLHLPLEESMKISLSGEKRNSFIDSLVRFLEQNLERKIEIKSLKVLHEVLI